MVGLAGSATMSSAPTNRSLHCTLKVPVPSMPENSGQALSVTPGASQRSMNISSRAALSVCTEAMAPK